MCVCERERERERARARARERERERVREREREREGENIRKSMLFFTDETDAQVLIINLYSTKPQTDLRFTTATEDWMCYCLLFI